ncbi:MAG: FAD-containing oxidoreductase [Candidatus Binatia bacterium]
MNLNPPHPAVASDTTRTATYLRIAALTALAVTLLWAGREAGSHLPRFVAWIGELGALGPIVFMGGYVVALVAFVPASVLTLAAGAIFGLGPGVAYVFAAATTGSALAFLLARYVARGAVERRIEREPRFAAIDRAVAADGRKIVFLLRLSPAFPFTALNYALGLTRVRFGDFLLASVGMLPGTFLYVYYGKLAGEVALLAGADTPAKGPEYYAVLALRLAATVAVTAFVSRIASRALRSSAGEENKPAATEAATAQMHSVPPLAHTEDPHEAEPSSRRVGAAGEDPDARLLGNVRPAAWSNPEPAPRYDLVVIGAGAGGLVTAAVGAGLGGKVALVERDRLGGDCLNHGCVPSKALLHRARLLHAARDLVQGIAEDAESLDREFLAAMRYMREVRAEISHEDAAARYRDELGVDVFRGTARFTAPQVLEVDGKPLRFRKAVIATGARASIPGVPGLAEAAALTNETFFDLKQRPRRLAVLGGGPIGCELAQAMRRFGCEVTILEMLDRLVPREDPDAGALLERVLKREGIRLVLGATLQKVETGETGKTLRFLVGGRSEAFVVDEILVGAGRRPNIENLGLEAAGIEFDVKGVRIDDTLRTANRRVYAVGDCCMRWQFTHAADAAAKMVVQNALFGGRKKLSSLTMPWCTYTDPEIAHVGEYEHEARERGIEVETFHVPLAKVNRAVCDDATEGFVRVHTRKGSDRILGATVVASHAGEMISEVTLAMTNGLGLAKIAAVIHPYPTQAEGIKAAANAYLRTRLTPTARRVLSGWLRLARSW